jgi:hypothetical protein
MEEKQISAPFFRILLPLFTSVGLFNAWLSKQSIVLDTVPKGMWGIATLNEVDVGARVDLFYTSVFALILACIVAFGLDALLWKKYTNASLRAFLNVLAGIGLVLVLGSFFGQKHPFSISLVVLTITVSLVFSAMPWGKAFDWDNKSYPLVFLALSLAVGISDIFPIYPREYAIPALYSIVFILLLLFAGTRDNEEYTRILRILVPWFFLPAGVFIANEFHFLLLHNLDYSISTHILLGFFIGILAAWSFILFKRKLPGTGVTLKSVGYPLFAVAVIIRLYYSPVYPQTPDMFELANPANAVMRWYEFGEIPWLEAQSSHWLSNYLFSFIYTSLFGYTGDLSFMVYHFFMWLVVLVPLYLVLQDILKNEHAAIGFLLIFPFTLSVFGSVGLGLIIPFLFVRLMQSPTYGKTLGFGLILILLLLFRPDIGVGTGFATLFMALLYGLKNATWRVWKGWLFPAIALLLVMTLFLLFISSTADIDLSASWKQSMDYFGGSQAHGFKDIYPTFDRFAQFHYFVFPILVSLILVYFAYLYLKKSTYDKYLVLYILFAGAFYLAHAQRGLVRHSLMEQSDAFISSYLYLFLGMVAVHFTSIKPGRTAVFALTTLLLIINFRYPNANPSQGFMESFLAHSNTYRLIDSEEDVSRVIELPFEEKEILYGQLVAFLDQNLTQEQTFVDFSNTPMLYFYTHRKVPSYFNQSLQNVVTDYLQKEKIKRMEQLDIPIVVFSHSPANWFDRTDGVPNALRYHLLSDYIYENYSPLGNVGSYFLWRRNGFELQNPVLLDPDKSQATQEITVDLKHLPRLLGQTKNSASPEETRINLNMPNSTELNVSPYLMDIHSGDFIDLYISNADSYDKTCVFIYSNPEKIFARVSFTVAKKSSMRLYRIPVSWMYAWKQNLGKHAQLKVKSQKTLSFDSMGLSQYFYEDE